MLLPFVFGKGVLLGLAIAAPVGPIGILCIRRTLTQGRLIGFFSGCGAATADAFYGAIAAFGLTALSAFLVTYTALLQFLGGIFLCYLGFKSFFPDSLSDAFDLNQSSDPTQSPDFTDSSADNLPTRQSLHSLTLLQRTPSTAHRSQSVFPALFSAYTTTLALTITNPATILSFLAIFTSLGITQSDYLQSVTLVFGVFSGSLLWWWVLVSGVAYLRSRLTPQRLARFNQFSSKVFGLIIFGFGLVALVASLRA